MLYRRARYLWPILDLLQTEFRKKLDGMLFSSLGAFVFGTKTFAFRQFGPLARPNNLVALLEHVKTCFLKIICFLEKHMFFEKSYVFWKSICFYKKYMFSKNHVFFKSYVF